MLYDTNNFILINNWFDFANVTHPNNHQTPYRVQYVLFLDDQNALLDKMYQLQDIFIEMFNTFKCIRKYNLQIFQKALLTIFENYSR